MKFNVCPVILSLVFLGFASSEPLFSNLMVNVQKLKDKNAAITESLEKTAAPSKLANFASSSISKTAGFTAGALNSASNAIVNFAEASASWMRNLTTLGVNKGADAVIKGIQKYAEKNAQLDNMTLPDIDTKFGAVKFTASGGHFARISSLYKVENISLSIVDNGLNIRFPLSLSVVDTGYSRFTAKLGLSMGGSFRLIINKNHIDIDLRIQTINPCALSIEKVDVSALEGIKIEFKNSCKHCGSILSSLSSGLANSMKTMLKKQLQNGIATGISKFIKNDSFVCARFAK